MNITDKEFIYAGEIAHYVALLLNVILTSVAMLGLPNRSAYDSWWRSDGFCVVEGNEVPTEIICFFSLTASAVSLYFFSGHHGTQLKESSPLLLQRLQAYTFGNFAHGFGHIFLWFMGASPPLEISLQPAALANILMLMMFWVGTLRSVVLLPTNNAAVAAVAILGIQWMLGVPPELAFTYSQSVILLANSLDQLRKKNDYLNGGDGFFFFGVALYHLPLFPMYYLEMFSCSDSVLSKLGGHAVYDVYVGIAPFGLYYAVNAMKNNSMMTKKKGN